MVCYSRSLLVARPYSNPGPLGYESDVGRYATRAEATIAYWIAGPALSLSLPLLQYVAHCFSTPHGFYVSFLSRNTKP